MRILKRQVKGGPFDGNCFILADYIDVYRARKIVLVDHLPVVELHMYRINDCGVFIYEGKE